MKLEPEAVFFEDRRDGYEMEGGQASGTRRIWWRAGMVGVEMLEEAL